jgi:hypothetical protein
MADTDLQSTIDSLIPDKNQESESPPAASPSLDFGFIPDKKKKKKPEAISQPQFTPPPPPDIPSYMPGQVPAMPPAQATAPPIQAQPAAPAAQQGQVSKNAFVSTPNPNLPKVAPPGPNPLNPNTWSVDPRIAQVPGIGPPVAGIAQAGIDAAQDFRHNPATAAAAMAGSVPAGAASLVDMAGNLGVAAARGLGAKNIPALNLEKGALAIAEPMSQPSKHKGARELGEMLGAMGVGAPTVKALLTGEGGKELPKLLLPVINWIGRHPKVAAALGGAGINAGYNAAGSISEDVQANRPPNIGRAARRGAEGAAFGGAVGLGAGHLLQGEIEKNRVLTPEEEGAQAKAEPPTAEAPAEPELTPGQKARQERLANQQKVQAAKDSITINRAKLLQEQVDLNDRLKEKQAALKETETQAKQATAEAKTEHVQKQADLKTEIMDLDAQIKRIKLANMQGGEGEDYGEYEPPISLPPKAKKIELEDGSKFSPEQAAQAMFDPATPQEERQKLWEQFQDRVRETQGKVKKDELQEGKDTQVSSEPEAASKAAKVEEGPDNRGQEDKPIEARAIADESVQPPVEKKPQFGYEKIQGKPGYRIFNTETGETVSSPREKEEYVKKRVDALNVAEKPNTMQGKRLEAKITRTQKPEAKALLEAGEAPREELSSGLRTDLNDLVPAKHAMDDAEATYEAAFDSFKKLPAVREKGFEGKLKQEQKRVFDLQAEKEAVDKGEKSIVEVKNLQYPKVDYRFNTEDPIEAGDIIDGLWNDFQSKKDAFNRIKKGSEESPGVEAELLAAYHRGQSGPVVTLEHPNGPISVRVKPIAEPWNENAPTKDVPARRISEIRNLVKQFIEEERGSGTPDPIAHEIEQFVKTGKVTTESLSALWNTDKTLDAARRLDPELERDIRYGLAAEMKASHGIKFAPEEGEALNKAERLSPDEIGTDPELWDAFGKQPEKLNYLAERAVIRNDLADQVRDAIDNKKAEYEPGEDLPHTVQDDVDKLRRLEVRLRGGDPFAGVGSNPADRLVTGGTGLMYDYMLKDNPAFNALVRLHFTQVLPMEVGSKAAISASKLLTIDPKVREWANGFTPRGALAEARREANLPPGKEGKTLMAGVEKLVPGPLKPTVSPYLRTDLMDRMNFQDAMVGGIIQHGNKIDYRGMGGVQLVKDIVAGRAPENIEARAIVDGTQAVNKTTGMGYWNLNPDVIQDSKYGRFLTILTGQRYRVLRLQKDYIGQALNGSLSKEERMSAVRKLGTFTALTVAVGGEAALPKEADLLEKVPAFKPYIRMMKDVLNMPAEALVRGNLRDVRDKIRGSLIPGLGGIEANLLAGEIGSQMRYVDKQNWGAFAKGAALLYASHRMGGGGVTLQRLLTSIQNVNKGDKDIYPTSGSVVPMFERVIGKAKFSQIEGHAYGPLEGAEDNFLPGTTPKVGAYIHSLRRQKEDKIAQ